jgi:hypothetical protein
VCVKPLKKGKKKKDPSPNKRPYPIVQNAQWGALRGEIMKPIT